MAPSITFLPGPDFGELLLGVSEFADGAGREGQPRGPAGWDCEVRIVRHHLIALFWHPFCVLCLPPLLCLALLLCAGRCRQHEWRESVSWVRRWAQAVPPCQIARTK